MSISINASDLEMIDYIMCWSGLYTMRDLLHRSHYELLEICKGIEHSLTN